MIDLAFRMRKKIADLSQIERIVIHTSAHSRRDRDEGARFSEARSTGSRETLDHSVMYILAVALEDGTWHQVERRKRDSTL
ncbi:MAG: 2-methylcitrate dehydratase, partial [Acidobacteria bacterium]